MDEEKTEVEKLLSSEAQNWAVHEVRKLRIET